MEAYIIDARSVVGIALVVIALIATCCSAKKRCRHAILSSIHPFLFYFCSSRPRKSQSKGVKVLQSADSVKDHVINNWTNLERELESSISPDIIVP